MQPKEIAQRIRCFVVDNYLFGRDEEIGDDASFLESGIIDSTGVLELVTFIEGAFGVQVGNEELTPEHLDSVSQVSAFVLSKLGLAETDTGAGVQESKVRQEP
jgi:acyl carrier protein